MMREIVPPYLVPGYEATASYNDEDEADLKVLAQLCEMGADLSNPRHQVYYFYFDSAEGAKAAVPELQKLQFDVHTGDHLEGEPESRRWPVIAERTGVINIDLLRQLRGRLTQIAKLHRGEFDGWEAARD